MTQQQADNEYPHITPSAKGFLARGRAWAVEGATREEALANFREAQERHCQIMQRPEWWQQDLYTVDSNRWLSREEAEQQIREQYGPNAEPVWSDVTETFWTGEPEIKKQFKRFRLATVR